jgi:hypothetical protein
VAPGDTVRATLEVKNESSRPLDVSRLFLRGSRGSEPFLDAAAYVGKELEPGATLRRDFRAFVSEEAGTGALVIAGGAQVPGAPDPLVGATIATATALASFDRVQPFEITLAIDERPVVTGSSAAAGTAPGSNVTYATRTALLTIRSRANRRESGEILLELPAGWGLGGGERRRQTSLPLAGLVTGVRYNLLIPPRTAPGRYPVRARLRVGNKTYTATRNLVVAAATAGASGAANAPE